MRRCAWLALIACYSPAHLTGTPPPIDGATTHDTTTGDRPANCFGSLAVYCTTGNEPSLLTLPATIDTDTFGCAPGTSADQQPVCVFAATDQITLTAGTTTRVTGSHPLMLIATNAGMILINGTLSVSSTSTGKGAGAGTALGCPPPSPPASPIGAAGASYGTAGAAGGGAGGMTSGGQPASPLTVPASLDGGCAGQPARDALGGAGGGGVYLYTESEISMNGVIEANGAGGEAGLTGGGAGGGAGGLIALDANTIVQAGALIAHGGGGGGGGDGTKSGTRGADGDGGGSGGPGVMTVGGNGGHGAATASASAGTPGTISGGGGGGGDGFIMVHGGFDDAGGTSSPAPTPF